MLMVFWSDELAGQAIERAKKEGHEPVCRCAQTPSGGKHIGNLNDVVKAYFVYRGIADRGEKARFVHTTDDRDPMKDVPRKVADLDGKWHETAKLADFSKYMGHPYVSVPDPFGCCKSWAEHFTKVWMDGVYALGMKPELCSTDGLYREGKFEPYMRMVFEKLELSRATIRQFQESKLPDYIPFDVLCPNCGRITAYATGFDLENRTVDYSCGTKKLKKREVEGCGHSGTVPWSEGKLSWRFEWPAQWGIFNTTFEPFGKDHAEGAWPSGQEIARKIYGIEPPIPFVYEFFLVNKEKMSASKGNVFIVQDMLSIIEREPFMFFYAKRPAKQRDIDLAQLHVLVDEFDAAEKVHFGLGEERTEIREENYRRMYELSNTEVPKKPLTRVPYSMCASIAQVVPEESWLAALEKIGYAPKGDADRESVLHRLALARAWAKAWAPESERIVVLERIPDLALEQKMRAVLASIAGAVDSSKDGDGLQQFVYNAAKEAGIPPRDVFKACYRLILGKDAGPRLGAFLLTLDRDFVKKRLKLEV